MIRRRRIPSPVGDINLDRDEGPMAPYIPGRATTTAATVGYMEPTVTKGNTNMSARAASSPSAMTIRR